MKVSEGKVKSELFQQVLKESQSMARYAISSGKKVPGRLLEIIENASASEEKSVISSMPEEEKDTALKKKKKKIPERPVTDLSIGSLTDVHNSLAELVAPARPLTILMFTDIHKKKAFLSPIKLVSMMMINALVFLLAFIIIGLFIKLNTTDAASADTSPKLKLFLDQILFLSAAGMGASFAVLYKVNSYIVSVTFDPKYTPSYWIRFVLGLISGLILAELIPLGTENSAASFSKPLLALIGGFSADVVFRILNRLVSAVESLIKGDPKDEIESKKKQIEADLNEKYSKAKMKHASDLMRLKDTIGKNMNPDEAKKKINEIMKKLLPKEDAEEDPCEEKD